MIRSNMKITRRIKSMTYIKEWGTLLQEMKAYDKEQKESIT